MALLGPELKPGDRAPDPALKSNLLETVQLSATGAKTRILSVVPSLDTPVCSTQTKRFHDEATKLKNVEIVTISCDLPTAQARFCGAEKIDKERVRFLSDHADTSFGKAFGTLIAELRVECRAAFVVDAAGTIRYAEYVPEIANEPKYEAILACARSCAG